eukprot:1506099-Rhodomonas_salina.2
MEIQAVGAVKPHSPVLESGKVWPGEVGQVQKNSDDLLVPLRSRFVDFCWAVVRSEVNPWRHWRVLRVAPAETLFLQ